MYSNYCFTALILIPVHLSTQLTMSHVSYNEANTPSPSSYGTMEPYQVTMISACLPTPLCIHELSSTLTKNLYSGRRSHPYRLDDWGWKRSHRVRHNPTYIYQRYDTTHNPVLVLVPFLARRDGFPVLTSSVRTACPYYDLIHRCRSVGLPRSVCTGRSGFRIAH